LRVVAADRSHGDPTAVARTATPQATALRPLAPVHLRARRSAAGVALSWVRRTRRDGDSWATADVPLGEDSEVYAVDILSGATVVRSLAAAQPSTLYAAADELADFGTPQASLAVRVVQLRHCRPRLCGGIHPHRSVGNNDRHGSSRPAHHRRGAGAEARHP